LLEIWLAWAFLPAAPSPSKRYAFKMVKVPLRVLCEQSLTKALHKQTLYKNTNHQQMHKESFIINRNTFLHVSTLLGHLQGELFVKVQPECNDNKKFSLKMTQQGRNM
jgi:hypothetical protein